MGTNFHYKNIEFLEKYGKENVHPAKCTRKRGNQLLEAKRKLTAKEQSPQANSILTLDIEERKNNREK